MSITIVYANAADTYINSSSGSKTSAQNGSSLYVNSASGTENWCGQGYSSGTYYVKEAFESFTFTPAANEHIVAAHVRLDAWTDSQVTIELRATAWGGSVDTGDWLTMAELTAATLYGTLTNFSATADIAIGSDNLLDAVRSGGTLAFVACTTAHRTGATPSSSSDYAKWHTADYAGTSSDPQLVYSSVPLSTLHHVIGAQVQLSDGTWAVLDTDGATVPTVTLAHVNAVGSPTTIATISTGTGSTQFGYPDGAQGYALAVDDSDNLYVVGKVGNTGNTLAFQAFSYSGGTWTAQSVRTTALSSAGTEINQVVTAWHSAGTSGTLVVLAAHGYGDPKSGTDNPYLLVNCNYLLTGSGSLLRGSGDAADIELTTSDRSDVTLNAAGTLLDIERATSTRGYVVSLFPSSGSPPGSLGETLYSRAARYILASDGTSITGADTHLADTRMYYDSQAKARVIAVDSTRMLIVSAYPTSGKGITVEDLQNIGSSTTFTRVGLTYLDGETASMPAASTLASAATWDAVYDATANKLYVYYFDVADGRRLVRTSVDLSTRLATGEEDEVDATVGAAGSTNLVVRAARGPRQTEATLITVANRSSGGTLSTIYVSDVANVAPTGPTLTTHANYDATDPSTFYWTFEDPNESDTQSAYQLQIDVAGGANVVDTTKTASGNEYHTVAGSTISNDEDFQWRVKTWDSFDAEGEWSSWSTFSTASTGVVTIVDPASDNPDLYASNYVVEWEVSGITQDHYRVVVVNTVTSATLVDTGWVASAGTTYEVTGMASETQYQVQVTAQASSINTNTDTVLLTPDYSNPETPTITVNGYDASAYTLITTSNPTPTGSRPEADRNDILRRVSGSTGAYTIVATTQPSGTGRDYTAASGVTYEYVARAQATNGYTDSASSSESISFDGLWISDPLDHEGTIRQFPYGKASHSTSYDRMSSGTHYAGRELPVFDFGDQLTETFSIQVEIPYGSTWRDDVDAMQAFAVDQRVLTVRDARGRAFTGAMTGYKESDQSWGTQVSFTVTRASEEQVTI